MLLQVTGLTKQYGHLTALDNVSFSIRPGEVLGLIGPNGSGKTTLLEYLGGVLPADRGMVLEDGRPLTADGRRTRFFYLPEGIGPWPAQTVRWALDFRRRLFWPGSGLGPWGSHPAARSGAASRCAHRESFQGPAQTSVPGHRPADTTAGPLE